MAPAWMPAWAYLKSLYPLTIMILTSFFCLPKHMHQLNAIDIGHSHINNGQIRYFAANQVITLPAIFSGANELKGIADVLHAQLDSLPDDVNIFNDHIFVHQIPPLTSTFPLSGMHMRTQVPSAGELSIMIFALLLKNNFKR
jgi:hypothetical protein